MGFYTREEIEKVRGMDLLSYLRQFEPENLVKLYGNTYCTREHDSLKISNGKWMWFSQGFGGVSALDYLMKVKGCTFNQAMEILEGRDESPSIFVPRSRRKKLLLPNKSDSCNQIKAYLKTHGKGIVIDADEAYTTVRFGNGKEVKLSISTCIQNKLISF